MLHSAYATLQKASCSLSSLAQALPPIGIYPFYQAERLRIEP